MQAQSEYPSRASRPLVGVTPDLEVSPSGRLIATCAAAYLDSLHAAGAEPVVLAPIVELAEHYARRFDAFLLTGGNDPAMEEFGGQTHREATLIHPRRQRFEVALLSVLREKAPARPVLGVCLGMQMMALHAGGDIDQHLPDSLATHAAHRSATHPVAPVHDSAIRWLPGLMHGSGKNLVQSNHHQAVRDPGSMVVLARSDDGVIEAVGDPGRAFYLGVQWHPERTSHAALGHSVFDSFVSAAAFKH